MPRLVAQDPMRRFSFFLFTFYFARPFKAGRDNDVLRDLFVYRGHVVVSRAVVKGADDGRVGAADYTRDVAFGAPVGALHADLHQHLVAVHSVADGGWVDENVAADARPHGGGVGDDEPEAVAVHGQAPGDQV